VELGRLTGTVTQTVGKKRNGWHERGRGRGGDAGQGAGYRALRDVHLR
jgi:hypothetical protein